MKPFQHIGTWWLPPNEEVRIVGEVTFTENDQTQLMLQDSFERDFPPGPVTSPRWYPLIWGATNDNQSVTLLNCHEVYRSFQITDNEEVIYQQNCQAEVAFIGAHFADAEHIVFSKMDVQYRFLPQWASLFPYYGHQKPLNDLIAITEKGKITIQFLQSEWDAFKKTADLLGEEELTEVMRIRFEVPEPLPLEQWQDSFLVPFQYLISLATQRPSAIISLSGYIPQDKAKNSEDIPVQIAYSPSILPRETTKDTFPETVLFSLQMVASRSNDMINTWLKITNELDSTCRLFFGVQYTHLALDLHFLLIAQAVEAYQNQRFHKMQFSDAEYHVLLETVVAACPNEEQKEWLRNTLEYSNKASYRHQLKNIVSRTKPTLQAFLGSNSGERNTFVEIVYNTRNYFTHHTKSLASKAASGIELLYITKCLSLALQICFLENLSFSPKEIETIIHKHEDYSLLMSLRPRVHLKK